MFGTEKHRAHVDREGCIPLFNFLFSDGAKRSADARIVHHRIETSVATHCKFDQCRNIGLFGDIDGKKCEPIACINFT